VLLFILFMLPVFCCGLSLVAYLVVPPAPLDILVLGLDARPGEGFVTRTDSIMLVGLQPSRMRVSLLSVPRDLFITVPGYGEQRINTVNVLGENDERGSGPTLLAQSFATSFGVQPDRYVRLNFQGFIDLINAVGGVDINVERTIVDYQYPTENYGTIEVRFEPGMQHMDGERALQYARTRHSDDDYQRANRQQQVLTALSLKLINPLNWPGALAVITTSMDTNLSPLDIAAHAPTILLNAGRFDRFVIDRDDITVSAAGNAIPNYDTLAPWLEERFD
jgi:LCP family protein required for cell wall assembly